MDGLDTDVNINYGPTWPVITRADSTRGKQHCYTILAFILCISVTYLSSPSPTFAADLYFEDIQYLVHYL